MKGGIAAEARSIDLESLWIKLSLGLAMGLGSAAVSLPRWGSLDWIEWAQFLFFSVAGAVVAIGAATQIRQEKASIPNREEL